MQSGGNVHGPGAGGRDEGPDEPARSPGGGPSLADDAISAFVHAPLGVAVCEPTGVVIRVNDAVTRLLGYPAEELVGRDLFRLVEADLVGRALASCASLRDGSADTVVHDTRFRRADGHLLDVRVTTSAVRARETAHPHAVMHLEDISEREDLRRRLQHDATHDALTGLANRTRFLDELRRALPRAERHGQPVTVLYLDLDGFKSVNDTYGHDVGDEVLVAFSRHVRESVRPEDTAARLGGDEFAVLCEDTTAEQAALVVDRLTSGSWAGEVAGVAAGARVGVTVGAATSGAGPLDAAQLLRDADAAMYAAKARRRS
ncbi:GGDEF domain-containing protein [Kineococcus rubinsiae]|uniref:GGDEF domain-containing protein n=1 Tax=Kineococcus rubinsiae TaxID=2609562 RepID=UPI001430C6A3|nr:sensor domain-containing diguanylate cyclase [Kineococcus rubinsiae]NIZ91617.1 diguanylate cyclase [Kineococcus rubinsiae]